MLQRSRTGNDDQVPMGVAKLPKRGKRLGRYLVPLGEHLFLAAIGVACLLPFYAVLVTAIKPQSVFNRTYSSIRPPAHITFSQFVGAWNNLGIGRLIVNSAILSIGSALIVTGLAALAGFALARLRPPGGRFLTAGFIALMGVPEIVVIVPLFSAFAKLHLVNTYIGGVVGEAAINLPFGVFLSYTFMREIPSELFKAASVDGASIGRQFRSIAVPTARPVLATIAVISAIYAWNDLLLPLILWQNGSLETLMVGLANAAPGRIGDVNIPMVMAGVVVSVVPVIALFLMLQRVFVRGLLEGAVK